MTGLEMEKLESYIDTLEEAGIDTITPDMKPPYSIRHLRDMLGMLGYTTRKVNGGIWFGDYGKTKRKLTFFYNCGILSIQENFDNAFLAL